MRAVVIHGPRDVRVERRPDPHVARPTDAVVRVRATCVCGSDLWPYRGVSRTASPHPIGHELVGIVEEVGSEVRTVAPGQLVICPFCLGCGACQACRRGFPSACEHGCIVGGPLPDGTYNDGAQGERARIPFADANLVAVPGPVDDALLPHLLTLADVFCTGYHAAVSAGVGAASRVVVIGDGAVGLSAVLASHLLGAPRVVAMSRHPDRAALARRFGASDVLPQRGEQARPAVRALLGGEQPEAVLECVGTQQSMDEALGVVAGGGRIGFVGVPAGGSSIAVRRLFDTNATVGGGMAPVRTYIPRLLPKVLDGSIEPGLVFTRTFALEDAPAAYRAMDQRQAIKSLILL